MTNSCLSCQGKLQPKTITYTQWYEGQLLLIENVPAWVCETCDETYLDPEVVDQIQNIVWSDAPPQRTITTPVYDLKAV